MGQDVTHMPQGVTHALPCSAFVAAYVSAPSTEAAADRH
jgi:hypothetical protein